MINCQCMDGDDNIINGARWFLPNGNPVLTQDDVSYQTDDPYYNSTTLGIPRFTDSNSGTYTCSPNGTFPTIPPGDNITLNAAGKYCIRTNIVEELNLANWQIAIQSPSLNLANIFL